MEWIVGPGRALDPARHFIIVVDQLGNGLSSSPSNTPAPFDRTRFPEVAIADDVEAQRLLLDSLGVRSLALAFGYSMGAQQVYQWAVSHPERVERLVAICGTARTTPHNAIFLHSLRAALTADSAWMDGDYVEPPRLGMRAFGWIYASWGCSQPFYKTEAYRSLGFDTASDFVTGFWEKRYATRDPNNLLCMIRKWEHNDVAAAFGGQLDRALGEVRARATVIASETDLYFTAADMLEEAAMIPSARFRVMNTVWGHLAGAGVHPTDAGFISSEVRGILSR